jgi:hypothetical protein
MAGWSEDVELDDESAALYRSAYKITRDHLDGSDHLGFSRWKWARKNDPPWAPNSDPPRSPIWPPWARAVTTTHSAFLPFFVFIDSRNR